MPLTVNAFERWADVRVSLGLAGRAGLVVGVDALAVGVLDDDALGVGAADVGRADVGAASGALVPGVGVSATGGPAAHAVRARAAPAAARRRLSVREWEGTGSR